MLSDWKRTRQRAFIWKCICPIQRKQLFFFLINYISFTPVPSSPPPTPNPGKMSTSPTRESSGLDETPDSTLVGPVVCLQCDEEVTGNFQRPSSRLCLSPPGKRRRAGPASRRSIAGALASPRAAGPQSCCFPVPRDGCKTSPAGQ